MNQLIAIFLGIVGFALVISAVFYFGPEWDRNQNKSEAQKIIDFRNTDHSCVELKRLYLKYEARHYASWNDRDWYWEVRDRFIETGCIDKTQLDNLEFIKMCADSHITGCEISKLKYPEAYENFNFLDALNDINSTQWKQLGERT